MLMEKHIYLSQDLEHSSLCHIGPHCLSIPYILVASANPKLPALPTFPPSPTLPPPWQPQVCQSFLFCFVDMFICVVFYIPHRSDILWYLSFFFFFF